MVNEEHYARLKEGVEAWNKWRVIEPDIIPDLSGADLSGADLERANLNKTNLVGAFLIETNLNRAFLIGANLYDAKLYGASLNEAKLARAFLVRAFFTEANLTKAFIDQANLLKADLTRSNLIGSSLFGANLMKARLNEADLTGADLTGASLNDACLRGTNLNRASLIEIRALNTDFSNAKFTGACLQDWNINSATNLNDIDCQYVYLRSDEQERRPSSGEFTPGEFTKLFQKALETVDLIFADGIDWKAFLLSFQELQAEYGEENLSVQTFEKKSGNAFIIRLEVPPDANKAEIEFREKELYQQHILLMEAQIRNQETLLNDYKKILNDTRKDNTDFKDIIKTLADNRPTININMEAKAESNSMSESYQSKYDQRNSNNQFVDTAQSGSNLTFNQQNFSQNINQNIDEITRLINSLREKAQVFPQDKREEVLVHLDDLQEDINKPEKQKPERIKTRIITLITIAGTVFGVVANSADFTNNVLEIADKLGIPIPTEISQPQQATQQLPPTSH